MNTKFNSQIATSLVQSERLLSLGLKKETADMKYLGTREYYGGVLTEGISSVPMIIDTEDDDVTEYDIPAWSLHRLIEMMPFDIWHTEYEDSPHLRHTFYFSKYAPSYNSYEDIDFRAHPTLYDNIIDCIEWLIKEGYFLKEYLEEEK